MSKFLETEIPLDDPDNSSAWPLLVAIGVTAALAIAVAATRLDGFWLTSSIAAIAGTAVITALGPGRSSSRFHGSPLPLALLVSVSSHLAMLVSWSSVDIFEHAPPLPGDSTPAAKSIAPIEVAPSAFGQPSADRRFAWQRSQMQPHADADVQISKRDTRREVRRSDLKMAGSADFPAKVNPSISRDILKHSPSPLLDLDSLAQTKQTGSPARRRIVTPKELSTTTQLEAIENALSDSSSDRSIEAAADSLVRRELSMIAPDSTSSTASNEATVIIHSRLHRTASTRTRPFPERTISPDFHLTPMELAMATDNSILLDATAGDSGPSLSTASPKESAPTATVTATPTATPTADSVASPTAATLDRRTDLPNSADAISLAKPAMQTPFDSTVGPPALTRTQPLRPALKTSNVPRVAMLPDTIAMAKKRPALLERALPKLSADVAIPTRAFRNRVADMNASPDVATEVTPAESTLTETTVERGLKFLASRQNEDGSWSLEGFDRDHPLAKRQLQSDAAATGLAILAFQGGGYNHVESKYSDTISRGIAWLVEHQDLRGGLYVSKDRRSDQSCRMYSHGIATLALTEAYGMTQDPKLYGPAQEAVDYIAGTQHPKKGGWRYFDTRQDRSTDTSVSGWMMMALHSASLADLRISRRTRQGMATWLSLAVAPNDPSRFRYNPFAVDRDGTARRQGIAPSPSMTSIGLLIRVYSGWSKSDPRLIRGVEYLQSQQLPSDKTRLSRDTYYWYYATQVMRHVGGEHEQRWNAALRPILIQSQERAGPLAGSWHPYEPVPDRWGVYGGRLYVTAMNLLSLEVKHRMLPIFKRLF